MSSPDNRTAVTSPPSGTSTVPGLGEAFTINLSTGQGVYSYKLALPAGVAGHGPSLGLEYAHGTALGPYGLGWRLALRSISRRLDFGVPGGGAAERWLDGTDEIVETPDGSYAAATERAFTRYSRSGDGWLVEERNGIAHECGLTASGRVADSDDPERVHEWLIERSLDPSGNTVEYAYLSDGGTAYPASVRWAAYELRFTYEERPDVRQDARAGFLRTAGLRCSKLELFLDPGTATERRVRSWELGYREDPSCGVSLLATVTMTSHGAADDGSQDVRRAPLAFAYSGFDPSAARVRFMEAHKGAEPPSLDTVDTALVTLDDAPLPGVLQAVDGTQLYWPNLGDGRWGAPRAVGEAQGLDSFGSSGVVLADATGSGTADMLVGSDTFPNGYYENGGSAGWGRFVAYPQGHAAAPPWASGAVRLTDCDADGVVDAIASGPGGITIWRNNGADGWSAPEPRPFSSGGPSGIDLADARTQLADMNGDGLDDLVRISSGLVEYWPGLGDGRFGERVVMAASPELPRLDTDPASVVLVDLDCDGCADLVSVTADGLQVAMNRSGGAYAEPVVIASVPAPLPGTLRAVNMNAGAGGGLLWCSVRFGEPAYVQVEFSAGGAPYLLSEVDNGSGLRSQLRYRPAIRDYLRDRSAGSAWTTRLPFPLIVVAGTHEEDTISGQVTAVSYRYHDGHFDPDTRTFDGFGRTERVEAGDESRADTLTVFHYLMGQERLPGNGPEHAALNGQLARTEIFELDGGPDEDRPHHVEECAYDLRELPTVDGAPLPRSLVIAVSHRGEDYDRTDDVRVEERSYEYDDVGNVVREQLVGSGTRGGVEQPQRERVTEIEYARSSERYLLDLVARVLERDADGAIANELRRYYDGPDFAGLGLGDADRGLCVREERLVLSASDFAAHYTDMSVAELGYHEDVDADGTPSVFADEARCAHDERGLRVAARDAAGNEERYEYDPDGLFRVLLADSLGETRYSYDRALGQPLSIAYGDGAVAGFAYDAQGRVTATLLPGDDPQATPRTFAYDDASIPAARWSYFHADGDTTATVTYFDGHGAELQQRVDAGDGRVLVSPLRPLNPWGEPRREYEPTEESSLAFALPGAVGRPCRRMRYDARGRLIETRDFNGAVSRAEHRPFEVVLYDAGRPDTPRHEEVDVLGDRVRVVQELGDGQAATTSFDVDAMSNLVAIDDDSGRLSVCTYDRRGGRLTVDHREAGLQRVFHDARGVVMRSIDADGNDLRAEIDAQGRLARLTLDGTVVEELTYDDLERGAFGRLSSVTYPGGRQDFTYDAAGRILREDHSFDGAARAESVSYEYDALGREVAAIHTDGRRIERELTANGWVRAIPGIVDDVAYDARGLPVAITYANGVVTELAYTNGPGRLRAQRTTGPRGEVLQDVRFDRDALGTLTRSDDRTPGGPGRREFSYDPLGQLATLTNGAGPSIAYDYDAGYNLAALGDTGALLHHDDAERPYRLTGVTSAGGALDEVGYDAAGNTASNGARSFSYDYKHALTRFEDGRGLVADYRYDHCGTRISKVVDDGHGSVTRTYFVGRAAEIRNGTPTIFVHLGGLRVAVLGSNGTRFAHPDPLGSTAFFTDERGTKIAAIAYLPFGNVAASIGDLDERTFGEHPFDAESGLYYMQRRHYDPTTASFLQPDPIAVLKPERYVTVPRAYHPYAYCGNDPLNNADPDGMSFWSVVGAIAGAIAGIAIVTLAAVASPLGIAALVVGTIGLMTVSYVAGAAAGGSSFGEFMRGFSIGLNAGLNAMLGSMILTPFVGVALGVVNFLAAIDTVAGDRHGTYQPVLGWSSWLMPMSWLITGAGLGIFLIDVVAAGLTGNRPGTSARIDSIGIDWATGAIVTHGGIVGRADTLGYTPGNFVYVNKSASMAVSAGTIQHELGHTLNNAAFGAVWQIVGWIDENFIQPYPGDKAYAERLAESHDPAGVTHGEVLGGYLSPLPWWSMMWR